MKLFLFTLVEFDALRGVSDLSARIYVVLRRWMDFNTGKTGGWQRRISHQMLREECECWIPRGAGYQKKQPSQKQIRVALAGLERTKLIVRLADEALVFSLPKAEKKFTRPFETGQKLGRESIAEDACQSRASRQTGQASPHRTRHTSGVRVYPSPDPAAAGAHEAVDKSSEKVAADFLSKLSKTIGYPIQARHDDRVLLQWIEVDMCATTLEGAANAAKTARLRDSNPAPLNPAYISAFLSQPEDWQKSWRKIVAKGEALGVHKMANEHDQTFKSRVLTAAAREEVKPCF
jgi:hypothetical protein